MLEQVDSIVKPGDRCLLKSAVYSVEAPVQVTRAIGTPAEHVAIAAAGDGPVVIDGTVGVHSLAADAGSRWRPAPEVAPNVFALQLRPDAEVTQLFIGNASADETLQMLVPARWPNARFDDKTMYEGPEHWAHAGPAYGGGQHNVSTGVGLVYDAGACRANDTCCSFCNNNSLAASGINATGAVAILNLWADGTGVQIVDDHQPGSNFFRYTATWCKAEIERRGKCGDGYRNGNGRYYLEASLALLDAPTEWFFSKQKGVLYLYPPDGRSPDETGLEVRAKASTYALEIVGGSSYLDLANISFVATTITATSYDPEVPHGGDASVNNIQFESLNFSYPSSSRRMMQDLSPIDCMAVWANVSGGAKSQTYSNHSFVDVAWRYADGMALQFQGLGGRFDNCIWEWNSWTALGSMTPGAWENGGTFVVGSPPKPDAAGPMFRRLSFANNGGSKALRPPSGAGKPLLIELVHFERQLQLADDGCFVETGGPSSAHMRYNWCTGSGKEGLRFDGSDKTGTANGEMSYNTVWNNSGFGVKGNSHNISHNTVFDAADIGASKSPRTWPSYQDGSTPLDFCGPDESISVENPGASTDFANNRTIFDGNLADRITMWKACVNDDCPFAGDWRPNNIIGSSSATNASAPGLFPVQAFDIDTMLRDPWNHDFRACPGSEAGKKGAGAYPVWAASDTVYRIPGAKRWGPSQPSPKADDAFARVDAELLFLGAFRARGHVVFFGNTTDDMVELVTLHGEQNIARPGPLAPKRRYFWRVVAQMMDDSQRIGPTWTFTTEARRSCVAKPSAGSLAQAPTRPSCLSALDTCCGLHSQSDGGNVKGMGSVCMKHMARHNDSLADPETGCTLVDEEKFCDPCGIGVPFCDPSCQGMRQRNGIAPLPPGCCRPGAPNPACCKIDPIPLDCCVPATATSD